MSITWHIDNLSAFKDILETRKLFSKCAQLAVWAAVADLSLCQLACRLSCTDTS